MGLKADLGQGLLWGATGSFPAARHLCPASASGYKALTEKSAIVRFQVKGADEYFLAWTTTPWTLASNTALCVNPKEEYCKVKAADSLPYLAKPPLNCTVLGSLAKDGQRHMRSSDTCIGKVFRRRGIIVVCDDYVTMTDGTGIVHISHRPLVKTMPGSAGNAIFL